MCVCSNSLYLYVCVSVCQCVSVRERIVFPVVLASRLTTWLLVAVVLLRVSIFADSGPCLQVDHGFARFPNQ